MADFETLYMFLDGEGVEIGIGTDAECTALIADGVLPANTSLHLVGAFSL